MVWGSHTRRGAVRFARTSAIRRGASPALAPGSRYLDEPPRVVGGRLVRSNITAEAAELELEALADDNEPLVYLVVECPAGRQQLTALVRKNADAGYSQAGTAILTDQPL